MFLNGQRQSFCKIQWQVTGWKNLRQDEWYFVTCNHQTWADHSDSAKHIVWQYPFIKFFLKKELIWVTALGLSWWALDFLYATFTKEYLASTENEGKDFETTRIACAKNSNTHRFLCLTFWRYPSTQEKHKRQNSPYKYLLKPKAGSAAFVIGAMGQELKTMLDITIFSTLRESPASGIF